MPRRPDVGCKPVRAKEFARRPLGLSPNSFCKIKRLLLVPLNQLEAEAAMKPEVGATCVSYQRRCAPDLYHHDGAGVMTEH